MIDYRAIFTEFKRVADERFNGNTPAITVIKARQGGPTPPYPYIVLDIVSTIQTSGYKAGTGLDSNNNPYVETPYKLLLSYTVYGDNANQIAHDLESYFRLDRVLGDITNNTSGGRLEDTFDVISAPEGLATNNLEVATFNLTFNIIDRYVDPQTGRFDTIRVHGNLTPTNGTPQIPVDKTFTSNTLP